MQILANFLLFIIPSLGMVAGLSLSASAPLFLLTILYLIKDRIKINFSQYKLEITFFLWMLMTCFWSLNSYASFVSLAKNFSIATICYLLIINSESIIEKCKFVNIQYVYVLIAPVIIFYIEVLTDGGISIMFRNIIQKKDDLEFYLFYLDRGCSLLSLFSWVVIAQLIKQNLKFYAFTIYIVILTALYFSDSLSGFVGFATGGLIFLLLQIPFFNNPKILFFPIIVGSIIFVFISTKIDPNEFCKDYDFLPFSSKHRIFIWSFAAEKFIQNPILGYGYDATKYFDIKDADMIIYEGTKISPLPTHPHNNIIQILLETGIIGFILYMSLVYKYLSNWQLSFSNEKYRFDIQASGYGFLANFFIISMISFNMWQSWWVASFLWSGFLLYITTRKDFKNL